MREIRTFELEHGEPATAWRATQPLLLQVMAGELWLTVEGDSEDYWLAAGETFELSRGALAWLSAGQLGARLALTAPAVGNGGGTGRTGERPALRTARAAAWSWVPRWWQTT
jgi:quercetin dioxygenase-like cupin family protein